MAGPATPYSVDVVIPVFNGAAYLERALASVISQERLPASIIVVDDGSTDATAEVAAAFTSPVPLTYLRKENGGPNSARNAGVRLATGEYVAFLDADDEWCPDKLFRQMELFERGAWENLGAVYSGYDVIDEDSALSARHFVLEPDPDLRGDIFEKLLQANLISGSASAIVVRRACFERAGLFDETLRGGEDWDMWLRLARHYQFDFVPERVTRIRRHGGNKQKDTGFMFAQMLAFYDKWAAEAARHGAQRAWSRAIICSVLRDLPSLGSLRLARRVLTPEAKEHLFRGAFADFVGHLVRNAPQIAADEIRRLTGRGALP